MRFWPLSRARAACAETRDWLLLGTTDPAASARAARHLQRCPECQGEQARLHQVRADLQAGDPPLDDLTRARMLDRLRPALDDLASGRARSSRKSGWMAAGLLGAVVAAAGVAVWFGWGQRPSERGGSTTSTAGTATGSPPAPPAIRAPGPLPAPALARPGAPAARSLALIHPEAHQAGRARNARGSLQRMVLAKGTRQRSRLGEHARLLLVGPAELEVLSASDELLEVRLARGTLVAQYRRGSGERLRVLSPGARTEVVGTTFAIEAGASSTRVSVSHGRVLVRGADDHERLVTAGQLWSSTRLPTAPLTKVPRGVARLFSEHARAHPGSGRTHRRSHADAQEGPTAASSGPSGAVASTAAAAPDGVAAEPGSTTAPALPAAGPTTPAPTKPSAPAPGWASALPPSPAPVPPLPPTPPPTDPSLPSAASIYASAEQAMGRGDLAEARRRLVQLLDLPQAGALAGVASYELAQIALRSGDLQEARRRLEGLGGSDLAEPADFLACEIELRAGDREAARRCYRRFRARHPRSVQDAEALGALLGLSPTTDDCAAGRALLEEYLARYPRGPLAAEVRRRHEGCPR